MVKSPERLNGAYRNHEGCQRAKTVLDATGSAVVASTGCDDWASSMARSRGTPWTLAAVGLQPCPALAPAFWTAPPPHHGQPQQPVQKRLIGLHQTNPVARHGQYLAVQQAGP